MVASGAPVNELIHRLGLAPHPEGGWYRELWRSPEKVVWRGVEREAFTGILFLLEEGQYSRFHRIAPEEIWHFHSGAPLRLVCLTEETGWREAVLGPDPLVGHCPFFVVPGGGWQAAASLGGWSLVSCTVVPAFSFSDFQMPDTEALCGLLPDWAERIRTFPGHPPLLRGGRVGRG